MGAKRTGLGLAAVTVAGAGVVLAARRSGPRQRPPERLVVTVYREPAELEPLPDPLLELGHGLSVHVTPAPGGRGTEIAVSGPQLRQDGVVDAVRLALRESKQIAETGEVLSLGTPPHGHRTPTPAGKVLDAVVARSRTKGLL